MGALCIPTLLFALSCTAFTHICCRDTAAAAIHLDECIALAQEKVPFYKMRERDAVVETEASDGASKMIQQLTALRGIGVQSATVLVREAFVRRFANGKALGSYAGLASSPYSSGGIDREQGIGKAGNRRVRTVMVELAWLWTRYQPGAAQVCWFRERVASTGRRVRKIMVVALARKLLIALWRFVIDGVLPEGAVLKPAA